MAIKITDWIDGDVLVAVDLKDSINSMATGPAVNANKTLKAAGAYENGGFTSAENYTVAAGINGTVNTGTSTAIFNTDSYTCALGTTGEDATSTSSNGSTTGTITTTIEYINATPGYIKTFNIGNENSATSNFTINVKRGATVLYTKAIIGIPADSNYTLEAEFSEYTDSFKNGDTITYELLTVTGLANQRTSYSHSGTYATITSQTIPISWTGTAAPIVFREVSYVDSTVIQDTNTITLDGTQSVLCLYSDQETPTDTSITVDISDGTTTISAVPVTNGTTGVVDISSLGAGTLELTWNLATTDTAVTPKQYGWGVFKIN